MKIKLAIVSTTINGDKGYRVWDESISKFSNFEAKFYIAADKNSVSFNDKKFKTDLFYLSIKDQEKYQCSSEIGWKKWARRNIALLEALKDNPDYVLLIDDDNGPLENYFEKWFKLINKKASKILNLKSEWFNYLDSGTSNSYFYPRGFPISKRGKVDKTQIKSCNVDPNEIYLFQGISLGDPDIDAFARIADPTPLPLKKVNIVNYVVKNKISPYNTQNTLFKRELAPMAFTWPHAGRYEDIYSSFVWQKYIFDRSKYVHVGDSINFQNRGERDNFKDFKLEHEGYLMVEEVYSEINKINTKTIESTLLGLSTRKHFVIKREKSFFLSFLEDLKALKII